MDYYYKYFKYKQKYINLKKYNMIGGDKPSFYNLKNINLFPSNTQIEQYLNPVYGFIWNESGAITNYLNFKNNENNISKLVISTFYTINSVVQLSSKLYSTVKPSDLGQLLAYHYLYKITIYDDINKINNIISYIDKLIEDLYYKKTLVINKSNKKGIKFICDRFKLLDDKLSKLKDSNYESIMINDIKFDSLLIDNNDKLYDKLNKYLITLSEYKTSIITNFETKHKITYSSKEASTNINSFIIVNGNFKIGNNDNELFHVILAIVWWISNNKNGIKEYYEGINSILPLELQVTIPEIFITDIYTKTELENVDSMDQLDFYNGLANTYKLKKGSIHLYNQQYSISCCDECKKYPDCGESTIRNFINIITYNIGKNNFDIEKLKKLNPKKEVLEYYEKFNNIILQSSEKEVEIFNKQLNARDAWSIVVSNLPGVNYKFKSTHDENYWYEIEDGLSKITKNGVQIINILQVLRNLFICLKDWNDFETKLDNKIEIDSSKLDQEGFGIIQIMTEQDNFYWHFQKGHYKFEKIVNSSTQIDINELMAKQQFYIKIFNSSFEELFKESELINNIPNWYYYLYYTPDNLISVLNYNYSKKILLDGDYNLIFVYVDKNYNEDQKRRIYLNLNKINKINDISNNDLEKYNFKYDTSGLKKIDNIIECKFIINEELSDSLDKLTNLENLTLGEAFNQKLANSLDNLVNLKNLYLSPAFNQNLGESLNKLTKLETLVFKYRFNQELANSLDKLVNLKSLIFGTDFNQKLANSLNNLANLNNLEFGNNFNQDLANSLNNLANLNNLEFGNNFNQDLGESLNKLTKLERLDFKFKFNKELGKSLDNLVNLKSLIFFYSDFNQELANSLDYLVNLENLTLGKFFNQKLANSLDNLVNLKNLTLGEAFNQELANSLDNLVNLKNLTFELDFNQELANSLNNLVNLENLTFGLAFNQKLANSLYNLVNLKNLYLSSAFNQNLGESLNKFTKLETLVFKSRFNKELANSLNNLVNLKNLTFGNYFNQELANSLNNLANLENLTFGNDFNQDLGNLDNLKKLKKIRLNRKYRFLYENSKYYNIISFE